MSKRRIKPTRDIMDHVRKTAKQMNKGLEPGQSVTANLGQRDLPENLCARCTCGGVINTRLAMTCVIQLDGTRKWMGVPCDGCENTYTIESSLQGVE